MSEMRCAVPRRSAPAAWSLNPVSDSTAQHVEELERRREILRRVLRQRADHEVVGVERAPLLEIDLRRLRGPRHHVARRHRREAPAAAQVGADDARDVERGPGPCPASRTARRQSARRPPAPSVIVMLSCASATVAHQAHAATTRPSTCILLRRRAAIASDSTTLTITTPTLDVSENAERPLTLRAGS